MAENILYYGDNLDVMTRYVQDETVDLVYADPPFKSNQNYNVLFQEKDGKQAASQILAFEDTWKWDQEDEEMYADLVSAGGRTSDALQAFRQLIGSCDMLSYLVMMAPRLMECRRALKETGSMYLHCDPSASHYLKLLMDAVFGPANFRNEVVWCYRKWSISSRQFARNHDCILHYSKNVKNVFFNVLFSPLSKGTLKRWKGKKQQAEFDGNGRRMASSLGTKSKGSPMSDWWEISIINPAAKERLGYPTQKPISLLERIINSSCPEGGTTLDPFCGCGTTVAAAQKLKRSWIGIDITHLAITLIKGRLKDAFGKNADFTVKGEPISVTDAAALAASNPFQFQFWALGLVGARPEEEKKGADKGIDGKILFQTEKKKFESVIISVKAGKTSVAHVRDLRGVLDREKAAIGVLISMQEPTRPMCEEAVTCGFYKSQWGRYPKMQILTVEDIINGKQIEMPPIKRTFKKAQKEIVREGKQGHLFG